MYFISICSSTFTSCRRPCSSRRRPYVGSCSWRLLSSLSRASVSSGWFCSCFHWRFVRFLLGSVNCT